MASIVTALRSSQVDVLAAEHIHRGYYVRPSRGRTPHRLRWRCPTKHSAVVRAAWRMSMPLVGFRPKPYDLHLHLPSAIDVSDQFEARVRAVIPAGQNVEGIEQQFSAVLMEAPSNDEFVSGETSMVLMPPPVLPVPRSEPVDGLPDTFFLTVFNPYSQIKGSDLLHVIVEESPVQIVWCHSDVTRAIEFDRALINHPKIVHVSDATPSMIRYLYERCLAYVSLSFREGFGWAIADALIYGAPLIARRTGVLTIPGLDLSGVDLYESTDELRLLVKLARGGRSVRDTSLLSEEAFRVRLAEWYSEVARG